VPGAGEQPVPRGALETTTSAPASPPPEEKWSGPFGPALSIVSAVVGQQPSVAFPNGFRDRFGNPTVVLSFAPLHRSYQFDRFRCDYGLAVGPAVPLDTTNLSRQIDAAGITLKPPSLRRSLKRRVVRSHPYSIYNRLPASYAWLTRHSGSAGLAYCATTCDQSKTLTDLSTGPGAGGDRSEACTRKPDSISD